MRALISLKGFESVIVKGSKLIERIKYGTSVAAHSSEEGDDFFDSD